MNVDLEIEERELILSCLIDLSVDMKKANNSFSEIEVLKVDSLIKKIKDSYYKK